MNDRLDLSALESVIESDRVDTIVEGAMRRITAGRGSLESIERYWIASVGAAAAAVALAIGVDAPATDALPAQGSVAVSTGLDIPAEIETWATNSEVVTMQQAFVLLRPEIQE